MAYTNLLNQVRVGVRPGIVLPTFTPLLDLYGSPTAAYSLRRLSTSYNGSAIRVRRSIDNTEQNIGFTSNGDLDTTSLSVFTNPTPLSTPLLETYTGIAVAYSLRKLKSSYTGSAIRVRRSSDNAEQNIGFIANGDLDTVTLLSFVGAGNGFVTTWYDQSANSRNAYQTTAAYQPFIVNAGSIVTNGGKPAIRNTSNGGFFIDNVSIGATNSMYALIDFGASAREYFGTFGNSWAFYQPNGEYKASGSAAGSTNAAFSLNRFISGGGPFFSSKMFLANKL